MFSFALWDRQEKKILLARDRYGIKPLYYSFQGNRFAFASENKAIITHPRFRKVLNKAALYEYFTFQNIFTDQTLLSDINTLPPGHWMLIDPSDPTKRRVHQYWDFDFKKPETALSREEYVEELNRLFVQAVQRQLVSDVEVGVYLSGGIDSGSLTAVAAENLSNLKSFTCGFASNSRSGLEFAFDEREAAESVSALYMTELYQMVLKSGDMERCLPSLSWHIEEPRVGQSYPNFYAAKLASSFVKVVLAGTGGDEVFGGYPWRYFRAAQSMAFDSFVDAYYVQWQRLVSNAELHRLFAPIAADVKHVWTRDIFADVLAPKKRDFINNEEESLNLSMYLESKTFLPGLLAIEDKLSMAHGLETRVPFLDNDLLDFASTLPPHLKVSWSTNRVRLDENLPGRKTDIPLNPREKGKILLRSMAERYLPETVVHGRKRGFAGPDEAWFRGDSIDRVRALLQDSDSPMFEIIDREAASNLISDHLNGRRNKRLLIWSLLNVDSYLKLLF